MLWFYTRFGNFPPVVMDFVKGIMYLVEAEWLLLICTVKTVLCEAKILGITWNLKV